MAKRYIGDAVITITYRDRGDYAGTISVPKEKKTWKFDDLHAPGAGLGPGVGYDSPKAYDEMAGSAVSFGGYYTTHNRGDDVPDWAPKPEVADAIDEATSIVTDDQGNYEVRRSPNGKAYSTRRNPRKGRKAKRATPKGRKANPLRGRHTKRLGRRSNCPMGRRRNPIVAVSDIPKAPFYAVATDKGMSGWGKAEGKTNIHVIPAPTYEMAEIALENLQGRSEMRRARIVSTRPRAKQGVLYTVPTEQHRWFERGAFTKPVKPTSRRHMKAALARSKHWTFNPKERTPSRRRNSPMTEDEAREKGFYVGWGIATEADFSPGTSMDEKESEAFEMEMNARDFSPFEFFAHKINESEDSDGLWEAYDEAVVQGIREGLDYRFQPKRKAKRKAKPTRRTNRRVRKTSRHGR